MDNWFWIILVIVLIYATYGMFKNDRLMTQNSKQLERIWRAYLDSSGKSPNWIQMQSLYGWCLQYDITDSRIVENHIRTIVNTGVDLW